MLHCNKFVMNKQSIFKLVFLIAIIGSLSLGLVRTDALNWLQSGGLDPHSLVTQILFSGLIGLLSITLLPTSPLLIASGYLFGPLLGGGLSLAGLLLGALIAFGLTRYCLYEFIRSQLFRRFPKLSKLDQSVQNNGFFVAITIRFLPIPAWAINYGLSLSPIRFVDYTVGSLIGLAPIVFIIVNIGSHLTNIKSIGFIISIILYVLFLAAAALYRRKKL